MSITNWSLQHRDAFRDVRVLVSGGAGFIGSHLTAALLELRAQVVVVDDLSMGAWSNLAGVSHQDRNHLTMVECSILDEARLGDAVEGCRFIFHLAACTSVPRSIEEPRQFVQTNIDGTRCVLDAARKAKVSRLVFASSSSVYGGSELLPTPETAPLNPMSPYARTKATGEQLMIQEAQKKIVDTVSLRFFNVFGPRQRPDSQYAAVIPAFADSLCHARSPMIYGDGEQSRDFTFVENVVQANLLAARCDRALEGKAFNVATGKSLTINHLAERMMKLLGRDDCEPCYKPTRAGDVLHSSADLRLARDILGYIPVVDFATGLRATVDWFGAGLQG